jgi:hypothetical protein
MLGSPPVGEDNRDRQDGVSHEDHHHTDRQALEVKPAVVVVLDGIPQQDGKQEHEPVPHHPPPRKPPATSEIAAQQLKSAHGVGMPASPLVHAGMERSDGEAGSPGGRRVVAGPALKLL